LRSTDAGARRRPARGIILADTKFEFGTDADGTLRVMDEVLTPDSSRFWPADRYAPGRGQPSLDKQPLRDHLEGARGRGALGQGGRRARASAGGGGRALGALPGRVPPHHGAALDDFPLHAPETE
jgi:phosphoribosylaminoimidazole-succinocarboxamide synthase